MKESIVRSLDEKDLEFAEILGELGMSRKVARLVVYLANTNGASSRDIEIATNLRQPEVSIGMRTLRNLNWIKEEDIKLSNRGRPMKLYSLNTSLDQLVNHLQEEKLAESSRAMESIQRLKEIAAS
jgi:predicted transcriptional regulator